MNTQTNREDAVDFLLDQHRQVRELFGEIEQSSGRPRRRASQALVRLLAVHETAEEIAVWPTVMAQLPEGRGLAVARKREENRSKKLLSRFERIDPSSDSYDQKLAEVKALVLDHAEREEREVFPLLRQHKSESQLRGMRTTLIAAEAIAPTHPHPHAPESAVGNLLLGPPIAIVDRMRDAVRALAP
jgi:hemerythrin superfamily protein